jgi:hypothetical protein
MPKREKERPDCEIASAGNDAEMARRASLNEIIEDLECPFFLSLSFFSVVFAFLVLIP